MLLGLLSKEVASQGLVAMYHSSLDDETENMVLSGFSRGQIRCVMATIACGMGVKVQDVRHVFHYGYPSSVLEYWQVRGI